MTRGCVVGGCNNRYCDSLLPKQQRKRISLHGWPKDDPERAAKWTNFVNSTRKFWKGPTASSTICGDHFVAPDDFVGYGPWVSGHRDRLDLQPHAVPTVKPASVKLNVQSAQRVCGGGPGTPERRKSAAVTKLKLQRDNSENTVPEAASSSHNYVKPTDVIISKPPAPKKRRRPLQVLEEDMLSAPKCLHDLPTAAAKTPRRQANKKTALKASFCSERRCRRFLHAQDS